MAIEEFKFFIDNTEILESPQGWDSLVTTIRLDRELKGLFTIVDASLTFYKDGFQLIKAADDSYGYCHQMKFEIRQYSETAGAHLPIYTGLIFLKDTVFKFGIQNETGVGSVKCQIQDNSFFARIKNNRNLKAKIYVGKSKNNVDIAPCPYQKIEYFSCPTGGYYATLIGSGQERNNTAFRIWDVLKYFVDYMSDGEMDFLSDAFSDTGIYGGYLLSNVFLARFAQIQGVTQQLFEDNWEYLDFATVFTELDKEFNICFVAGFNGGRPYLRIENFDYLYPNVINQQLDGVNFFERKYAIEYLYDKVIVGSDNATNEPTFTSFPYDIRFLGAKREEYTVDGTCNIDRSLDICNKWIIDSNTLELMVEFGGSSAPVTLDAYNTLIKCTFISGTSWSADQSNWVTGSATPVFYNEQLNSNNKTTRYLGAIPNSIGIQLGIVDNTFSAKSPTLYNAFLSNPGSFNPADYSIVLSDPGGNYNPTGFYFTAPVGGVYTFSVAGIYSAFGPNGVCLPEFDIFIDVYAAGDTPGVDPPLYSTNISPFDGTATSANCTNASFVLSHAVNMATSNRAAVRIIIPVQTEIQVGSIFSCTASADGGGAYKTFDPKDVPIARFNFKYPFNIDSFLDLQADPRGLIAFGIADENLKYGHLEELKFYNARKESDWTLIATERVNE